MLVAAAAAARKAAACANSCSPTPTRILHGRCGAREPWRRWAHSSHGQPWWRRWHHAACCMRASGLRWVGLPWHVARCSGAPILPVRIERRLGTLLWGLLVVAALLEFTEPALGCRSWLLLLLLLLMLPLLLLLCLCLRGLLLLWRLLRRLLRWCRVGILHLCILLRRRCTAKVWLLLWVMCSRRRVVSRRGHLTVRRSTHVTSRCHRSRRRRIVLGRRVRPRRRIGRRPLGWVVGGLLWVSWLAGGQPMRLAMRRPRLLRIGCVPWRGGGLARVLR
mmetsp:Transcript_20711/g.61845  ORF Transcript_20711/g.61845 Transcript_20711/m.61845 type:complete len:277 (+) Transcript_20711:1425-2255(+)